MWDPSQTRARTRVSCIGRRILNHCATREAQFVRFKLHMVLSSVMKSGTVPFCPTWDVDLPFAQRVPPIRHSEAPWLSDLLLRYHGACVHVTLIYLIMAPKHSDAGNSGMPRRSHKVFPLSGKVKVLNFIRKGEKNQYAEIAKIYRKNEPFSHEIGKKKFILALLSHLKLQ